MRRHRITLFILFVLCCVSLLFNTFLVSQAKQYYLDMNRERLDPLGLESHPATVLTDDRGFDGITVAFLGDSRAAAWIAPSMPNSFRFVDSGIDAQTSAQVRYRFDHDIGLMKPDVIILQVGVNDLKTIPLFPDQEKAIIERTKRNIVEIVTKARGLDATVILTTVFPTGDVPIQRRLFWSPRVDVAIEEVNAYISSLQAPGVVVLDTHDLLLDHSDRRSLYIDELHLNSTGYELLNQKLAQVLTDLSISSHEPATLSP